MGEGARARRGQARGRWLRGLLWLFASVLLAAAIGVGILWWTLPEVDHLAIRPPATTAFIELRKREALAAGRPFELHWSWRSSEQISPYLHHAVVASEDARFFRHDGVDWTALRWAARRNLEERRWAYGASTISQQVAKNLFLSPSKNPLRKLREMWITHRLESELGKTRILEIYLNVAEWGDGVFGAEAAAQTWFGVSAAELSPAQAARLAVALPNPRSRNVSVASPSLDKKAAELLYVMWRDGLIDEARLGREQRALRRGLVVRAHD